MFTMIAFAIAAVAAVFGYSAARKFVRDRLRFVEGAHKPAAPVIAGIGAYLIALVVVGLLPIVGWGTAAAFALSVAFGTAAGSRQVKSGDYPFLSSGS
jgi:hypothetical protein